VALCAWLPKTLAAAAAAHLAATRWRHLAGGWLAYGVASWLSSALKAPAFLWRLWPSTSRRPGGLQLFGGNGYSRNIKRGGIGCGSYLAAMKAGSRIGVAGCCTGG